MKIAIPCLIILVGPLFFIPQMEAINVFTLHRVGAWQMALLFTVLAGMIVASISDWTAGKVITFTCLVWTMLFWMTSWVILLVIFYMAFGMFAIANNWDSPRAQGAILNTQLGQPLIVGENIGEEHAQVHKDKYGYIIGYKYLDIRTNLKTGQKSVDSVTTQGYLNANGAWNKRDATSHQVPSESNSAGFYFAYTPNSPILDEYKNDPPKPGRDFDPTAVKIERALFQIRFWGPTEYHKHGGRSHKAHIQRRL